MVKGEGELWLEEVRTFTSGRTDAGKVAINQDIKGNIYAEGEAAKVNLTFWLIHGLFMLFWYSVILGAYLWYLIGYTIYWMFKYKIFKKGTTFDFVNDENAAANSNSIRENLSGLKERAGNTASKLSQKTEGIKNGAAEKTAIAKEKAGATFAGIKDKTSAFASEHKRSDDGDATVNDVIEETNIAEFNEESTATESFDELYEKAMSSSDNAEEYDESFDELSYDTESSLSDDSIEEPVAEPEIIKAPAPATVPNTTSTTAPQQFNYEEKKSPVAYVMGGIIALLLVGIGILGGILLKNNSSSKPNASTDSNEISVEVSATSNAASSVAEIGTTKTQTTAVEDTVTSTTEKSNTSVPSNKEIEEAKNKAVTDLSNNLASTFSSNHMSVPSFNVTTDYDINGDDIPELIISYFGVVTRQYHIFYYNGSQYVELNECWGGLEISETNHLILERGEEGGQRFSYYELSNDYKLNKIDELTSFPLGGDVVYYRNEQQITSSEYYAALDYYKDMNWRSISSNSANNVDSGNSGGSDSGASTSSMYSGYANIENAPSDMTFVDNTSIISVPTGTIKTESTGLNLRKGPGTSYDVLLEIPKGERVFVYGRNSEWCYVGWERKYAVYLSSETYQSNTLLKLTKQHSSDSTII